jgi:hypothetical protein
MNIKRETKTHDAHCADTVIHCLVAKGKLGISATPDPEAVIEEIWSRATCIGAVMEGILHEPHPTHMRSGY